MSCIDPVVLKQYATDAKAEINSRRGQILKVLSQVLDTIHTQNGYSHNVYEVSFDVNSWRDRSDGNTPVIYIVDDPASVERKAGKTRLYTWNLLLFGVTKDFDTLFEFEEHLADVEECLEHNGWLGGLANKIEVNSIKTDNQMFSEKTNTRLYEIAIQVEYVRCLGDAR